MTLTSYDLKSTNNFNVAPGCAAGDADAPANYYESNNNDRTTTLLQQQALADGTARRGQMPFGIDNHESDEWRPRGSEPVPTDAYGTDAATSRAVVQLD